MLWSDFAVGDLVRITRYGGTSEVKFPKGFVDLEGVVTGHNEPYVIVESPRYNGRIHCLGSEIVRVSAIAPVEVDSRTQWEYTTAHYAHPTAVYLNKYGDEGWELVAFDSPTLIFKRPKE